MGHTAGALTPAAAEIAGAIGVFLTLAALAIALLWAAIYLLARSRE